MFMFTYFLSENAKMNDKTLKNQDFIKDKLLVLFMLNGNSVIIINLKLLSHVIIIILKFLTIYKLNLCFLEG